MNEKPEEPGTDAKKTRSPLRLILMIAVPLLLVASAAYMIGKGSGDDSSPKSASDSDSTLGPAEEDLEEATEFDVLATPSTGAGPNPLKISFKTKVVKADGDVTYSWKFDENGATATGPNPTFTYKNTGWKFAKVTARDGAGHTAQSTNALRVWPPKIWNGLITKKISPAQQQKILVDNLKAYERKTGGKIAGIGAAPLPGQKPLTPESRRAQRREPALIRRANRRATREYIRKKRAAERKKRQQEREKREQESNSQSQ